MPPSPIITVEIDEQVYRDCCISLELKNQPGCRVLRHAKAKIAYSNYNKATNFIRLFVNYNGYDHNRLPFIQTMLVTTLLHELRHAWQAENWTAKEFQDKSKIEPDAEQ